MNKKNKKLPTHRGRETGDIRAVITGIGRRRRGQEKLAYIPVAVRLQLLHRSLDQRLALTISRRYELLDKICKRRDQTSTLHFYKQNHYYSQKSDNEGGRTKLSSNPPACLTIIFSNTELQKKKQLKQMLSIDKIVQVQH